MNIKHFFKHDWETIMDGITVMGYSYPKKTEVLRNTIKICKVCGKLHTDKKVLESYDLFLEKDERDLLASKLSNALGIKTFNNGEI